MSKTMRAAVATGLQKPLSLEELPVPEPGPGQVLVRLAASGVCHTDVNVIDGDWPMRKPHFPLIPGHEGCGHVAGLGRDVGSLKEGDRVGVFWLNSTCGACEYCVSGRESICPRQEGTGYSQNGTYAEYCLVSADYAVPLPKGELEQLAPIMCAGVTSYKALKQLRAAPGSWVVVSGVGGTGHLAIQYARVMGLNVAAVDIDDEKVAQAERLGAAIAVNAARRFPANRITSLTGGAHAVIATANSSKAQEQALRMLRRGGTCILIGIPPEALPLGVFDMVIRELTVRGSLIGTREDVREALQIAAEGGVTAHVESRPLEAVNAAVAAVRDGRVNGRLVLRLASD